MKTIIIDNYDSFTYNLAHLLKSLGTEVDVRRNDRIELPQLETYDNIVLSPGPGIPSEAGRMPEVIAAYARQKPILGICLGHQAIAEAFGAELENLARVFHGVQTPALLQGQAEAEADGLFRGLPPEIAVGSYHSWAVRRDSLPSCLAVTALSPEGAILALKHRQLNVRGLQFHPESILTPQGRQILGNWLSYCQ